MSEYFPPSSPKQEETPLAQESPASFAERIVNIKKRYREMLGPWDRDSFANEKYEAYFQRMAEYDARIAVVGTIETKYRLKKFQDAYLPVVARKEKELLTPFRLTMKQGESANIYTHDNTKWDYLEYEGKHIDRVHEYLADPERLERDLKRPFSRFAEKFKKEFEGLPEPVRDTAIKWVHWIMDKDGVGLTLDQALASGMIKQAPYDDIMRAHANGKKIFKEKSRLNTASSTGPLLTDRKTRGNTKKACSVTRSFENMIGSGAMPHNTRLNMSPPYWIVQATQMNYGLS